MGNFMSDTTTLHETPLYLIGIRVDGTQETPTFHTFVQESGTELVPLLTADATQIVLFTRRESARRALDVAGMQVRHLDSLPDEVFVADFAGAFYLLQSASHDPDDTLLDLLNCLTDLFRAVRLSLPEEVRQVLAPLAEHLAQSRDIGAFLDDQLLLAKVRSREKAINALRWCLGALLSHSRLLLE